MKIDYEGMARTTPKVMLAESLVPPVRLELRIDMEKQLLRFAVMKWDKNGNLIHNTEYPELDRAVEAFNTWGLGAT